ncbi:hypothetical protein J2Y69_002064 [Microbacterium resistens]|uniref:ABC transporter n=1 Tax=Microbacterium resistens TaxID=156977 RepID=A0ABU1SCX8_9MICO|nr:ABC transporter [Microbacterium resistens]MDR6867461.1 hypothetical protein [Microbacterium resistens]
MSPRIPIALSTIVLLGLTACSATPSAGSGSSTPSPSSGHGAVSGAAEVAEPPLALVSVDGEGRVGMVDLLDGGTSRLGETGAPSALASDGRYLFLTTERGVEIVDSGVWTWDHVDHFHYYRAAPAMLGTVDGAGPVVVATGPLSTAGTTGVFFEGSGEAVLLDNQALSKGKVVESFRVETGSDRGIVAPFGDGAVVASGGLIRRVEADGSATADETGCEAPEGVATTRVGLVIGCADGAVLLTLDRGTPVFERIPYPPGAERAVGFDGRKGRPTVAALAGDAGYLLLDTRERSWERVETGTPLVKVSAVGDDAGHVVAVDVEGRVRVYAGGVEVGATDPLVSGDPGAASLWVDAQRAYVNAPAAGAVYEIAYADGGRVARVIETPTTPSSFAEVGR